MIKVCFVFYDLSVIGGAEQVGVNLANDLCEEFDVNIYSLCKSNQEIPYEIHANISVKMPMCGQGRIRQLIKKHHKYFIEYIKNSDIDIVIAIGGYAAVIVLPTRFFTKARYIFCDHGALKNQWNDKRITFIRWLNSKVYHHTVVLTDESRLDYIRYFRLKPEKVSRIYNWIPKKLQESSKVYRKESKKILSVGRFSKEKGYDLLIRVAEKVLPRNPEWEWDVYGDGEEFEKIENLVFDKKLERQLKLKGNVAEVSRLFNEYAFFVLPSYREGLPLVLLEAKVNKLPMISFDIQTGPNEIIDHENGILIPPYDCDKMAEAVENLIRDSEYRCKLSDGTNRNLEKFSYHSIRKQWINLIQQLREKG